MIKLIWIGGDKLSIIQGLDNYILMLIQDYLVNPVLNVVMPIITTLGNGGAIWIAIAILLLINKKYRKYGVLLSISLLLCLLVGNIFLKPTVARIRPFDLNDTIKILIEKPMDYSFPSGHTMSSFAAATILFYMNKKIGSFAYILASRIAFSRLYLYVHFPSDVLTGLIVGVLLSSIVIKVNKNIELKK